MLNFRFTLRQTAVSTSSQKFEKKILGPTTEAAVDQARRTAVREARRLAPFKTGRLRKSIGSKLKKDGVNSSALIFANARSKRTGGRNPNPYYAEYVEKGTRPHVISAYTANVLAYESGGKKRFGHTVNHPGTRARPFLIPGGEFATVRAPELFGKQYERIASRAARNLTVTRIGF